MKNLCFLLSLVFTTLSFAQQGTVTEGGSGGSAEIRVGDSYFQNRIRQSLYSEIAADRDLDTADIVGSIYLKDGFLPSKIQDSRLNNSTAVLLRYNIYNDIFEVKYGYDDDVYGLIKNKDFVAELNGKKFIYQTYTDASGKVKSGYLEIIESNKDFSIYKQYYQQLTMPRKARTSLESDVPARINTYSTYYIERNNELKVLKLNRKDIASAFPENKNEINTFIKKERLKFKDDKDILKLATYIKSIQ